MKRLAALLGVLGAVGLAAVFWLFADPPVPAGLEIPRSAEAVARGEYLVTAGGCAGCHRGAEDPERLSGGLAIESDFGTFYAPNITPDRETGIGAWTARDFVAAIRHGRAPDGGFYYPAFPYRAYAGLSDGEVLDMAAWLLSTEPVRHQAPEPELPFWLRRWTIAVWNRLADLDRPPPEDFDDAAVARGAALARHLGHCGECHTPRNGIGIPDQDREFAGGRLMDETIEPIDAEALAGWTAEDFDLFLLIGMKPDGEFVGGDMNEVVERNTSRLSDADRAAMAAFFTRIRTP